MEQIKLIFNCNCQHATDTLAGSMVSLMFYTSLENVSMFQKA